MWHLYQHELKLNIKSLLIWTLSIASLCFVCILLYTSLEGEMQSLSDSMANMGAFTQAFGMDQLSIATLEGFYAVEVGTIHSLGGGMFAALLGILMLSKEEEGHTSEFLYVLPLSRTKILISKYLALLTNIIAMNIFCVVVYYMGFVILDEPINMEYFLNYHILQVLLHIEIASICFFISSLSRKNNYGLGLGMSLLFYLYDLMARILPALEDFHFLTPYAYANASDVFSGQSLEVGLIILAFGLILCSLISAYVVLNKKDIA